MKKIKSLLLSLIVFSFFLPVSNAQLSSDFNLNQTHDWLTIVMDADSGIKLDFNQEIKPEPITAVKTDSNATVLPETKLIAKLHAGKDISPKISDKGRVKGILELIGKIARHEQLQFSSDGKTFSNREKRLPIKEHGFYKEYTFLPPKNSPKFIMIGDVEYEVGPSLSYRGPERLIIGGNEIVYYTPDHYAKFARLKIIK